MALTTDTVLLQEPETVQALMRRCPVLPHVGRSDRTGQGGSQLTYAVRSGCARISPPAWARRAAAHRRQRIASPTTATTTRPAISSVVIVDTSCSGGGG